MPKLYLAPSNSGNYTIEASRYQFNPPLTTGEYNLTLLISGANQDELNPLSITPDFGVEFEEILFNESLSPSFTTENDLQYFVIGAQHR